MSRSKQQGMICCINWRESSTISHKMERRGYDDAINFAVKYFLTKVSSSSINKSISYA